MVLTSSVIIGPLFASNFDFDFDIDFVTNAVAIRWVNSQKESIECWQFLARLYFQQPLRAFDFQEQRCLKTVP